MGSQHVCLTTHPTHALVVRMIPPRHCFARISRAKRHIQHAIDPLFGFDGMRLHPICHCCRTHCLIFNTISSQKWGWKTAVPSAHGVELLTTKNNGFPKGEISHTSSLCIPYLFTIPSFSAGCCRWYLPTIQFQCGLQLCRFHLFWVCRRAMALSIMIMSNSPKKR